MLLMMVVVCLCLIRSITFGFNSESLCRRTEVRRATSMDNIFGHAKYLHYETCLMHVACCLVYRGFEFLPSIDRIRLIG